MAEAVQKKAGGRIREYFKGVRSELRKVTWPSKKDTYKYTLVVLVICALFAIFFWLVDTGCLLILRQVLNIGM